MILPKKRNLRIGDMIHNGTSQARIASFPLFQPGAPRYYEVIDEHGAKRTIRLDRENWTDLDEIATVPVPTVFQPIAEIKLAPVKKRPPREKIAAAAKVNILKSDRSPVATAAEVVVSPAIAALHANLDEARLRYQDKRTDEAWDEYERCIRAVDQADPGYYLGRRDPLVPLPPVVLPDIDYVGIRSRMEFSEETLKERMEELSKEGILYGTIGICRVCGCTDDDCRGCIERTGHSCHWVESDLCSACAPSLPGTPRDKPPVPHEEIAQG